MQRHYRKEQKVSVAYGSGDNVRSSWWIYGNKNTALCESQPLITKFLAEAENSNTPVDYKFLPIWEILTNIYSDSEHANKVVNLRSYYLGFRNFDCPYLTSNGIELQKFRVNYSSSNEPTFQCVIPIEGCQTGEDCQYSKWPLLEKNKCYCKKNACIKHKIKPTDQGERQVPYVQKSTKFHGNCKQSDGKCHCTTVPDSYTAIWDSDLSPLKKEIDVSGTDDP